MQKLIDEIKEKIDIVEYIGKDISLKKVGSHFTTICPFHKEQEPSFVVYPDTKRYFCYGCRATGDVITFEMEHKKKSFHQAILSLASQYGIKTDDLNSADFEEKEKVYNLLTLSTQFFQSQLTNAMKKALMEKRGLSPQMIENEKLGFSPNDLSLFKFLEDKGYSSDDILLTGLFIELKKGSIVPIFQNRIIIPYFHNNKVVYMIARRTNQTPIEQHKQKYMKLKTSSADHSYISRFITNRHFLNEDSCSSGENPIILTEGTLDALLAKDKGYPCLSFCGTNIPEWALKKLQGFIKGRKLYIVNDNDTAGIKASMQTADFLFNNSKKMDIFIVALPQEKGANKIDLTDYLIWHGKDEFQKLLDNAPDYITYLSEQLNKEDTKGIQSVISKLIHLTPLDQDNYLSYIADHLKTPIKTLQGELKILENSDVDPEVQLSRDLLKILERKFVFLSSDGSTIMVYAKKTNRVEEIFPNSFQAKLGLDDRRSLIDKHTDAFKTKNFLLRKRILKEIIDEIFVDKAEQLPVHLPVIDSGINFLKKKIYFGFQNKIFAFENGEWVNCSENYINIADIPYKEELDLNVLEKMDPKELYNFTFSLVNNWKFITDETTKHLITAFLLYAPIWEIFDRPLFVHIRGHAQTGKSKLGNLLSKLLFNSIHIDPNFSIAGLHAKIANRKKITFIDEAAGTNEKDQIRRINQLWGILRGTIDRPGGYLRATRTHQMKELQLYGPFVFFSISPIGDEVDATRMMIFNTKYQGINYNPQFEAEKTIKNFIKFKLILNTALIPFISQIKENYNELKLITVTGDNRHDEMLAIPLSIIKLCVPKQYDHILELLHDYTEEQIKMITEFGTAEELYDIIMNTTRKSDSLTVERFWDKEDGMDLGEYQEFDPGSGIQKKAGSLFLKASVFLNYTRPKLQEFTPHDLITILSQVNLVRGEEKWIKHTRYRELFRKPEKFGRENE